MSSVTLWMGHMTEMPMDFGPNEVFRFDDIPGLWCVNRGATLTLLRRFLTVDCCRISIQEVYPLRPTVDAHAAFRR